MSRILFDLLRSKPDFMNQGPKDKVTQDNLLYHPHWFIRAICERLKTIPPERVDDIVLHTAAPQDSNSRTKSLRIKQLDGNEPTLIKQEIEKAIEGYRDIVLNIKSTENSIKIILRPEISYLGDTLLLSPWGFIRSVAELAGMEEEKISSIAMNTIAPKDERGVTKSITVQGLSQEDFQTLTDVISNLSPQFQARRIFFDLDIRLNDDREIDQVEIRNIKAEPNVFIVNQGKFVISESETQTAGLDTCTAVGIRFADGKNFLAHIDATTDTSYMRNAISALQEGGVEIVSYRVWAGSGMVGGVSSDLSREKAGEILNLLPFNDKSKYSLVSFHDKVGIRKDGSFYQS